MTLCSAGRALNKINLNNAPAGAVPLQLTVRPGNMNKCCGKIRKTNFCPNCGKALQDNSGLSTLLEYVRMQRKKAEDAKSWHEQHRGKIRVESGKVQRWTGWESALESAIEKLSA